MGVAKVKGAEPGMGDDEKRAFEKKAQMEHERRQMKLAGMTRSSRKGAQPTATPVF